MNSHQGWCYYCKKISYLKESGYNKEDVADNVMVTQKYIGKCDYCNRALQKVIVEVTEGENGSSKQD